MSIIPLVVVFAVCAYKFGWIAAVGITCGLYVLMPYDTRRILTKEMR